METAAPDHSRVTDVAARAGPGHASATSAAMRSTPRPALRVAGSGFTAGRLPVWGDRRIAGYATALLTPPAVRTVTFCPIAGRTPSTITSHATDRTWAGGT